MSTRANVIVKDRDAKLYFYRHSDGYPAGVAPTLNEFMRFLKSGRIRDNVGQAAGWLIVLGYDEYAGSDYGPDLQAMRDPAKARDANYNAMFGWKVGAYEPTTCIHGDIELWHPVSRWRHYPC